MKWIAVLLATTSLPLVAQWLNYPTSTMRPGERLRFAGLRRRTPDRAGGHRYRAWSSGRPTGTNHGRLPWSSGGSRTKAKKIHTSGVCPELSRATTGFPIFRSSCKIPDSCLFLPSGTPATDRSF